MCEKQLLEKAKENAAALENGPVRAWDLVQQLYDVGRPEKFDCTGVKFIDDIVLHPIVAEQLVVLEARYRKPRIRETPDEAIFSDGTWSYARDLANQIAETIASRGVRVLYATIGEPAYRKVRYADCYAAPTIAFSAERNSLERYDAEVGSNLWVCDSNMSKTPEILAEAIGKMSEDVGEHIAVIVDDAAELSKFWFPKLVEQERVVDTLETIQRIVDKTGCYALALDLSGTGPHNLSSKFRACHAPMEISLKRCQPALGIPRSSRAPHLQRGSLFKLKLEAEPQLHRGCTLIYGAPRPGRFEELDDLLVKI